MDGNETAATSGEAWKIVGVSVAGFSHEETGIGSQDAHAFRLSDDWLIAAISDGAGSANRSADGARAICEGVVSIVAPQLPGMADDGHRLDLSAAHRVITEAIELVRRSIVDAAGGDALADFHATLVGVVAGPAGGLFFHIGDGAACAMPSDTLAPCILSPPENGEYANETFFFTEPHWHDHLRITPFGAEHDCIALMSDGVTPFALTPGGRAPHGPFFRPISNYLRLHPREPGEQALAATLRSESVRAITGDDKTLLWALRVKADG